MVTILHDFVPNREIIETMVTAYHQKIFSGQKPVFDGRKNLYSRDALPIGRDKVMFDIVQFWVCLKILHHFLEYLLSEHCRFLAPPG